MNRTKLIATFTLCCIIALGLFSCSRSPRALRMATTTSTENSGLLDRLLPPFEKACNADVQVIAVGTGKALKLGENGDVDILMVHAPAAEKEFVANGHGTGRLEFMYNDFIILGPESDPAGVSGMENAAAALAKIAAEKQAFISRGDDSGTHKKERSLWAAAGVDPEGSWYLETGRGMGATLTMTNEKQAYTLTDRGTYLSMIDKLSIVPLVQGGEELYNVYSVIPVNPDKHGDINNGMAKQFIEWIATPEAQEIIAGYTVSGRLLFHPMLLEDTAGKE